MPYISDAIDPILEPAACHVGGCLFKAKVAVSTDLEGIMPYVNAVARVVFYDSQEPVIIFKHDGYRVAMRSKELAAATVSSVEEGRKALESVVRFLNELWERREGITPLKKERKRPPAFQLYKHLPKTNCKDCGEPTCLAFATRLSLADKDLEECRHLTEGQAGALQEILENA